MTETVAVIGAGTAGLSCARALAAAGWRVTLLEKSRGPGGRVATRRALDTTFDHGAQYFTARGTEFIGLVAALAEQQVLLPFAGRWGEGAPADAALYVGVPGMSAFGQALAAGHCVEFDFRVAGLVPAAQGWRIRADDGRTRGPYRVVAIAIPAPQASALQGLPARFAPALDDVRMLPCTALMAAFSAPLESTVDLDARPDAVLSFVCRNSAKPHRAGLEAWVLHADAAWSAANASTAEPAVAEALLGALGARLGLALPVPTGTVVHRWRYARVADPLGEPCLYDETARVGLCGDWCLGARVEAAYQSGAALATRILAAH